MSKKTTRDSNKQAIRLLLLQDPAAVEDALLALYHLQTEQEREVGETLESNGVGFSGSDANLLTSFARQIERHREDGIEPGRCLSPPKHGREGQVGWARRKLWKYAGQLDSIGWLTEERKASVRLSDGQTSLDLRKPSGSTLRSRTEALRDALDRIDRGRAFIADPPPGHTRELIARAHDRLDRLSRFAEQLVADATREDERDQEFRQLAKIAKPCPACGGEAISTRSRRTGSSSYCFRCGGKGYQTTADESRNDDHDVRRRR